LCLGELQGGFYQAHFLNSPTVISSATRLSVHGQFRGVKKPAFPLEPAKLQIPRHYAPRNDKGLRLELGQGSFDSAKPVASDRFRSAQDDRDEMDSAALKMTKT